MMNIEEVIKKLKGVQSAFANINPEDDASMCAMDDCIASLRALQQQDTAIVELLKKYNATIEICKMCDGQGFYVSPDQAPDGEIVPVQVQCEVCGMLGIYVVSTLPPVPAPVIIKNPDSLPF
jgi:hypothetical protein